MNGIYMCNTKSSLCNDSLTQHTMHEIHYDDGIHMSTDKSRSLLVHRRHTVRTTNRTT